MPHSLRIYKTARSLGFSDEQSMCMANVVERAKGEQSAFDQEKIIDDLCDVGVEEQMAEVLAQALRNCFLSQRFATYFNVPGLKLRLVRSGMPASKADDFLTALGPSISTLMTAEIRLPVKFVPGPGRVVMCDFTHLKKPEMQKERRAIVVSTKSASGSGRCTVVPVSKLPSKEPNPHHFEFAGGSYPFFHTTAPVWAVCDHVYTVSLERLWAVNVGLKPQPNARISDQHLAEVRKLVGSGFALSR
jgi:uncharacterized protein YifN (PemK superfamily)